MVGRDVKAIMYVCAERERGVERTLSLIKETRYPLNRSFSSSEEKTSPSLFPGAQHQEVSITTYCGRYL